jgi:predicted phage-related endonuclease
MEVQSFTPASREHWLELRRNDVTASDVGAVCGVHPYRSALQVYADKAGLSTVEETNIMRRGRWMEDAVLSAIRDQHPTWQVGKGNGAYFRAPALRMGATPDAYLKADPETTWVLQCKIVSRPVFEEDWAAGVPLHYQLQALQEAKLAGCGGAMVAALVLDTFSADLYEYEVPIVDDAWDRCVRQVAEFWTDIAAGRRPRSDYTKDGEIIAKLYKSRPVFEPVDMSGNMALAAACDRKTEAAAARKAAEAEEKAAKAEIIELTGGASRVICAPYTIKNTPVDKEEYIVKAQSYDMLTVSIPKGKK